MVQFVPFSKFQNDKKKLSNQVLEEIPRQIVDYYNMNNLNPEKIKQLLSQNQKNEYPKFQDIDDIPVSETIYINPHKKEHP